MKVTFIWLSRLCNEKSKVSNKIYQNISIIKIFFEWWILLNINRDVLVSSITGFGLMIAYLIKYKQLVSSLHSSFSDEIFKKGWFDKIYDCFRSFYKCVVEYNYLSNINLVVNNCCVDRLICSHLWNT